MLTDALLWALSWWADGDGRGLVIRNLFRRTLSNISATAMAIAGGDFRPAGQADRPRRRIRPGRRGHQRYAGPHRPADGRCPRGSDAIAHDLRTPITRARARLEDAALHAETPDDLRAAIERATPDLDGIVAVFQALLRIAEIEAGSRRSSFARLDLAPLLAEVAELYGAVAEERGISLAGRDPGSGGRLR